MIEKPSSHIGHPADELRYRESAEFKEFLPFIRTPGINIIERRLFIRFLKALHKNTSDLWKPSLCKSSIFLEKYGNSIINQFIPNSKLLIYNWSEYPGHWWNVINYKNKNLIIDPAGLNNGYGTSNLPFFGTLKGAESKKMPHLYYSNGRQISEDGYKGLEDLMAYTNRPR